MWDDVDEQVGTLREKELRGRYWKGMLSQGSKTFRYGGNQESAWKVVGHFLDDSLMLAAVQLQQELVDFKRRLPETKAGAELYWRLEELVKKQQETLQSIQKEMRSHRDEKVLSLLREEFEDQRKQVESTMQDMETLKIHNIPRRLLQILTTALRI